MISPRHIIIKLSKTKDKENFKGKRKKNFLTYKETPIILSDFSSETFQDMSEWDDILKLLKDKTSHEEYFTQKRCFSEIKERYRLTQTNKR